MNQETFFNQYISHSSQLSLPLMYKILRRFEIHRYSIVRQAMGKKYRHCLDIGCGDGELLFLNRDKYRQISGVDFLPGQIQKARKRDYKMPSTFYTLDVGRKRLPFNDHQFDLIISIATLQYVLDLDLLLTEILRTLTPTGTFIFEVPNFAVLWRRVQLLFGSLPSTSGYHNSWEGGVIHYFTKSKLEKYLDERGFVVEQVTCSGIFAGLRQVYPALLGANLIFICKRKH